MSQDQVYNYFLVVFFFFGLDFFLTDFEEDFLVVDLVLEVLFLVTFFFGDTFFLVLFFLLFVVVVDFLRFVPETLSISKQSLSKIIFKSPTPQIFTEQSFFR